MSEKSAVNEWLYVGARVATLRDDWKRSGQPARFAKVARIGKRDVVLDDEQRFNVARLERSNGGAWDGVTKLLPAESPAVAEAMASWRYKQIVTRAKVAAENWRIGRDGTQPVDVILALAPLTGREDEIRALFEPGRPESGDAQ